MRTGYLGSCPTGTSLPSRECYVAWWLRTDPVLTALRNAPLDDEGVTEDDLAGLEEARKAVAEGRVYSNEEVMRSLGL